MAQTHRKTRLKASFFDFYMAVEQFIENKNKIAQKFFNAVYLITQTVYYYKQKQVFYLRL